MDETLDIDALADQFKDSGTPAELNDIMVIGVGGGGGNAVNHMFREGVKNVTFVVCNTDRIAVENSPVANKVVFGDGFGAGNKPEKARKFAEDDIDKIERIFDNQVRMVFVTAGMGGGTGTGAAPVIARVARERGLLTIGIVTIPFMFEGKRKIVKALSGADEMAKYVDALLVINNERLAEIYPDLDFFNAFSKADDTLATAARSISEIINIHGYMNLDFNDVDTTLRNGGTAIISTGYGEGEHRVTNAIKDALNSPLLRNRDIYGSKRLLMYLYLSREDESKTMAMNEISELREFVSSIDDEVDVIWGVAVDNTLGDKVKITILASGFDVTLRDDEDFEAVDRVPVIKTEKLPRNQAASENKSSVDHAVADNYPRMNNYIELTPEQMDDDAVIEILERSPAYKREKRVLDSIKSGLTDTREPERSQNPSADGGDKSGMRIDFMG